MILEEDIEEGIVFLEYQYKQYIIDILEMSTMEVVSNLTCLCILAVATVIVKYVLSLPDDMNSWDLKRNDL